MKPFLTLIKKEIFDWWLSPTGLVFVIGFLLLSHWLFLSSFFLFNEASLRLYFDGLPLIWIVFLPAVTMDRFALEKKQNTIELLESLPLSFSQIVFAKFLVSWLIVVMALAASLVLVVVVSVLGAPDYGVILSSYLGVLLLAGFAVSVGLFFSKLFSSSIAAYLSTVLFLLFCYVLGHPLVLQSLPLNFTSSVEFLSFDGHFQKFLTGVISLKSVFYFLLGTFFFLSLVFVRKKNSFSGFVSAICVVLFLSVSFIPTHYFWDGTQIQENTLSEQSKNILHKLSDRVVIKTYFSNDLPPEIEKHKQSLLDILQDFKTESEEEIVLQAEDVATDIERERARQIGIEPLMMTVQTQNERTTKEFYLGLTVHYQDKMDVMPYVTRSGEFEYKVALSLLKLSSKSLPKLGVVFSDEKAESSYVVLESFLDQVVDVSKAYENENLKFKDLDALLIIDPQDFAKKLEKPVIEFLNQNIPVLIFATRSELTESVEQKLKDNGMTHFLESYGLQMTKELILDADYNLNAQFQVGASMVEIPYPFWIRVPHENLDQTHPVTASVEELFLPWSHALEIQKPEEIKILVASSAESFLQESDHLSISPQYLDQMENLPKVKSHALAVEVKKTNQAPLFVMANTNILKNDFLNTNVRVEALSNATFLINLIEHHTWGDELIGLRSRMMTSRPLQKLSSAEQSLIFWGVLALQVVLPVLFVGLLWGWRRYRQRKVLSLISA